MYPTETAQVSAQTVTSSFIKKLESGRTKEAADEGSAFIRTLVRQDSFAREIINPVILQDDEIDRDEHSDEPKKIIEKEPDSVATFVQFMGSGPTTWFKGPRYAVYFGKTESQHFKKSKFQLMTYQNDIRKILSDNSVKDLSDQEDKKFLSTIEQIIAANAGEQLTNAAAFNSTAFKVAKQKLKNRRRPMGKLLMSSSLYEEALDLPATSVGNNVADEHYKDGVEKETRLWGMPVVTTIKSHIIDTRVAYLFSPENYLGNFFLLQDATLYIEQKADIITFYSYAVPGIGIGNRLSMQKIKFPGAA